jgi:hypothetical protein
MRTALKAALVAAVVLSSVWLSCKIVARLLWRPRSYRCAILTEDVDLRGQGTNSIFGHLKKGSILFAPSLDDMDITDPSDIQLHKIYVRLPPEIMGRLVLLPPQSKTARVPTTVCNILEAVSQSQSNGQGSGSTP